MLRSAVLILSGNATASLLLLARNLIVARLIPVEDFGIAATFAVAMAVVEMASALGLQQQIVQAKDGDAPHFQAALQGFQVLRGVFSGAVLFALAGPMARFMGIPEVIWAYQLLAVVPVLNALVHFDIHRLNRQMVFWPMLLTGALPALISLLAVWPFAQWYGDWRVMLYAIVVQAVFGAVVSHLVARRPYRLVFDRAIMAGSLRFGWPLLVEAILLFLVFQGDRLIVGRLLGMESLGVFSMGITLVLTPTLVLAKSAMNLFLPLLSSTQSEERFAFLSNAVFQVHILFAGCLVFSAATLGPSIVNLLLGNKYDALIPLLVWIAILQGLRMFRGGASATALARGKTGVVMISNLARVALLPAAWWIVSGTGDLMDIVYLGILGEGIGAIAAFGLVWWRLGVGIGGFLPTCFSTLAVMVCAAVHQFQPGTSWPLWTAAGLFVLSFIFSTDLRRFVLRRAA